LKPGENTIAIRNAADSAVLLKNLELSLSYAFAPTPAPITSVQYYVAPDGNDNNPGTLDKPVQSIQRVLDVACKRFPFVSRTPFTIELRGGEYRLDAPLRVCAPGSSLNLRILAYADEKPVISGAKEVHGWQPDADGRWKAAMRGKTHFRQIYVNGRRAVRARGECPPDLETFGTLDRVDGDAGFVFPEGAMAAWKNQQNIELGFFSSWGHMIVNVQGITRDAEGHALVHLRQPQFFMARNKEGVQAGSPAYIENALELLDQPGEWYHDRAAGMLYYWPLPGEDMNEVKVTVPVLEEVLRIEGRPDSPTGDVLFDGVTFADTTWLGPEREGHIDVQANFCATMDNAFERDGKYAGVHNQYKKSPAGVVLHAAAHCQFEQCTFTRLGAAGLDIECGSRENLVQRCVFYDLSGSAIQIGDVQRADHHPDTPDLVVRDNRVINTRIEKIGVEFEDSVGIFLGYVDNTVIAHNEIFDLPYSAITMGWGWGEEDPGAGTYPQPVIFERPTPCGANRIECNHLHHVMQRRDDGGAIYTLGNQPGTVLRGNHIHDNGPGGPGGVYLDEGSGFIEIADNLIYGVARAVNYNNIGQARNETCYEHDTYTQIEVNKGVTKDIAAQAGPEK
jgi:hypothetical protein